MAAAAASTASSRQGLDPDSDAAAGSNKPRGHGVDRVGPWEVESW